MSAPCRAEKVSLVAPPFVHEHEQVATGGPKVVEFTMTIEEKPVVIDDEGTIAARNDLQRLDPGPDDGRPPGRLPRTHAGQSRDQRDAAQYRFPRGDRRTRRRGADAHQSRRAGDAALQGDAHRNVRLPLRTRGHDPLACRLGHERHRDGPAPRRAEERKGRAGQLRQDVLHRRERLLHPARRGGQLQELRIATARAMPTR